MRLNRILVSSLLLSAGLLSLAPQNFNYASTIGQRFLETSERIWTSNYVAPQGFSGLTIILISLIAIWAGYRRREPWSWVVLFIVTWLFVFPVYVLPLIRDIWNSPTFRYADWFQDAVHRSGLGRFAAMRFIEFLLMVVGLFLPGTTFLSSKFQRSNLRRHRGMTSGQTS
jgi:hypothetical protein